MKVLVDMEVNNKCSADGVLNLTSAEAADDILYSLADTIIITLVMPSIMVIGHIGNIAFLFVMFRVKAMRTVTNFYLTNLAISDICFLSIAVGEKIWRYKNSPVTFDQAHVGIPGCILMYLFMNMSFFASIILVTLVSLEKYCGVCRPLRHLKISGKKRTITLILFAWFIALAFSALIIPGISARYTLCVEWPDSDSGLYDGFPEIIGQCGSVNEVWEIAYQGIQTIPFFLCLGINSVLYGKIISKLHRRATNKTPTMSSRKGPLYASHVRQRNQMSHMLVATGVIFFVCLAPFQVLSFTNMIYYALNDSNVIQDQNVESIVNNISRLLVYLNSAINPIVYNATNARYRLSFKDAFSCNAESRRRRYRSNMSSPPMSRQNSAGLNEIFQLPSVHESIHVNYLDAPD